MRILVTGGAGFIGSHVCERLLRQGHAVTILDDVNDFYPASLKYSNLAEISRGGMSQFVVGDIRDETTVTEAVCTARIEAIIHLAARAGVRASLESPLLYEDVNVRGTLVLLEAARRQGVERFIFASSSSVYGMRATAPFSEDDHCDCPVSPYAATKLAAEHLCYTYTHLYGLATVCLRLFSVYGPRQRPDLAISAFMEGITEGTAITINGTGEASRDYTYCDDIVDGVVAALRLQVGHHVVNLGSGSPVSLLELIGTIEAVLGQRALIEHRPDQPGDVRKTHADVSKAGQLLGYHPRTPLKEGVRKQAEWRYGRK